MVERRSAMSEGGGAAAAAAEGKMQESFRSYYKQQCILSEDEWDSFLDVLHRPLPTTFRLVGDTIHFEAIKKRVEDFRKLHPEILEPLRYLKPSYAYQLNVDRATLRKSDDLQAFHRWLVVQSEAGTIYRQEAVSMLPARFLHVTADSVLLDMAAAPGSKTSQLLEAMHAARDAAAISTNSAPTGAVVANDACSTRGHMLIHHLRHLDSPCLLVTNHQAQMMPNAFIPAAQGDNSSHVLRSAKWRSNQPLPFTASTEAAGTSESEKVPTREGRRPPAKYFYPNDEQTSHKLPNKETEVLPPLRKLEFDGVLCDVPCSGDGTLRKHKNIWNVWDPSRGLACHRLQIGILRRGLALLKPEGRLVYSTCTFNPLENEAVVLSALETFGDGIELLDVRTEVPEGLRVAWGMTSWKVFVRGEWLTNLDDLRKIARKKRQAVQQIIPSMFPDFTGVAGARKNRRDELHKCIRLFPHHNNCGGFFIAVFRKLKRGQPLSLRMRRSERGEEVATKEGSEIGEVCKTTDVSVTSPVDEQCVPEEQESFDDEHPYRPVGLDFSWSRDFVSLQDALAFRIDREKMWTDLLTPYGLRWPSTEDECGRYVLKFTAAAAPQRVWYVSQRVSELLRGAFRTPWKIQYAGCVVLEGRSSRHFRLRSCGYRWLPKTIQSAESAPTNVITVPADLVSTDFVQLLRGEEVLEKLPQRLRLTNLPERSPCILSLPVNNVTVGIPAWRGTRRIQLLLDSDTRASLLHLLSTGPECFEPTSAIAQL